MVEKEALSLEDIKKALSKIKELKDKKSYIKYLINDPAYSKEKNNLLMELAPLAIKDPLVNYNLIYDSLSEGLEPIYFWILDFMGDSSPAGLDLKVWKGSEMFEASVTSGYFGEIGQRSSLMQQKAMEYLATINNIIKSVLNLIYDLREFEIRLGPYDILKNSTDKEKKTAALYSLKGIWMDQVDAKKGRGSINLLVQDLQFVTLRDAFFFVNEPKNINNDLDLNERVKNILRRKLEEFNEWKEYSEKEIRKRYEIERIYLKAQEGTLRIYANWLKPYLIAAQKLRMRGSSGKVSDLTNPHIVNSFSNMEMEIKLYGKREIKPGHVHKSFEEVEIDTKYFAVTEVTLKFRSVPSALSGQGGRHYVHGGRTDIIIKAYALDNIELEAVENLEMYEDLKLIDEYVGTSLVKLQEEINKYTSEPEKEDKDKNVNKIKFENPFKGLFSGFKEIYNPLRDSISPKKKYSSVIYEELEKLSGEKAKSTAYLIYNTYKKTHGMLST